MTVAKVPINITAVKYFLFLILRETGDEEQQGSTLHLQLKDTTFQNLRVVTNSFFPENNSKSDNQTNYV